MAKAWRNFYIFRMVINSHWPQVTLPFIQALFAAAIIIPSSSSSSRPPLITTWTRQLIIPQLSIERPSSWPRIPYTVTNIINDRQLRNAISAPTTPAWSQYFFWPTTNHSSPTNKFFFALVSGFRVRDRNVMLKG